jgi:hypothetical protein
MSLKKAYQARMAELKEEIRQNKVNKQQEREKQTNVLCTGTRLQKVTSPKRIQKTAKSPMRSSMAISQSVTNQTLTITLQ